MRLFLFDTETTGVLPSKGQRIPPPYIVEFGALIYDLEEGREPVKVEEIHFYCKPPIPIPEEASKIHGITDEKVSEWGPFSDSIPFILPHMVMADCIVGHNVAFDMNVLYYELKRHNQHAGFTDLKDRTFCTMQATTDVCRIPGKWGKYKWPKLQELHKFLFAENFEDAHSALADIEATFRCLEFLLRKRMIAIPAPFLQALNTKNHERKHAKGDQQTPKK